MFKINKNDANGVSRTFVSVSKETIERTINLATVQKSVN